MTARDVPTFGPLHSRNEKLAYRRPGKAPGEPRVAGDPEVAGGFHGYALDMLQWMAACAYSPHSVKARRVDLGYFIDWCEERGIRRPDEVTRALAGALPPARVQLPAARTTARAAKDSRCRSRARASAWARCAAFFQWMARQHHLLYNPASELELPRRQKRLPRHILTVGEVEQILNAIDTVEAENPEPTGLRVRNRAMLETLYSTGMRRGELVALHVDDLDLERGTAHIRQGKGSKDRVVPVGERACRWIEKYLSAIRPLYLEASGEPDTGALFLARHGQGMQAKQLSVIVKLAIEAAQLERFAGDAPERGLSSVPARLRDAHAGGRLRHPLHPGAAGPCGADHHRGLHASEHPAAQGRARAHAPGAHEGHARDLRTAQERRSGGGRG